MSTQRCAFSPRVDAHFRGANSVTEEAEMRRHMLDGCSSCHRRYTRQALLSRVQPGAPRPQDRLARGLGFARPAWMRPSALFGAMAACAVLGVVLLVPRDQRAQFQARGLPAAGAAGELRVFKVRPGAPSEAAGDRLAASDELAFAYRNGAGKRHLFIFGVDEHRHVYWFSPAWRSAQEQPAAPVVATDGAFHEIEDAVGHPYDGSRLEVHALFTDRAWRVQELETAIAAGGATPFGPDVPIVVSFEVTR